MPFIHDYSFSHLMLPQIDVIMIAMVCPLIIITKWLVHEVIFKRPVAAMLPNDPETQAKMKKQIYQLTHHVFCSWWSYAALTSEPWFNGLFDTYRPYMEDFENHQMSDFTRFFYLYQFGYSVYNLGHHLSVERQHDFNQMLLHHVVTIILIWVSYRDGFFRVGVVILLIHDCSDIVLNLCKMISYAAGGVYYPKFFSAMTIVGALALFISWGSIRCIYFSHLIYWVVVHEAWIHASPTVVYFYTTFLGTLVMLHTYWWTCIITSTWKAYKKGGPIKDCREKEKEEEAKKLKAN
eukprot:GFYU01005144.1.p2 GENE.GFYU01005144.1~~GFYU01005144.1.p2  ORF type:complete len:293 (+),score=86.99 GFYU01005144.1:206-1084(+)